MHGEFTHALGLDGHRVPLQQSAQEVVGRGVHDVVVAVVPAGHLLVGGDDPDEVHLQTRLVEVPGVEGVVEMDGARAGEDAHGQASRDGVF